MAAVFACLLSGCGRDEIVYVYDGPIWCYHTLARPDCYAGPVPGEERRLIGAYVLPGARMPFELDD